MKRISKKFFFFLYLYSAFFIFEAAHGATQATGPHLYVEWVSETNVLRPGKVFVSGFHFKLEKGWHVYWKNPGDSGEQPKLSWELPNGVEPVGKDDDAILWPIPQRLDIGPLTNYGYETEVLLITPLKIAERFKTEKSVHLATQLRWLVCKESCIPGKAHLEIDVPVGEGSAQQPSPFSSLFDATRALLPVALPAGVEASGTSDDHAFHFNFKHAESVNGAAFFPSDPDQIENAAHQEFRSAQEALTLNVSKSDQLTTPLDSIRGLLVISTAATASPRGYEVTVPLTLPKAPSFIGLILKLLGAFLGGVILNLMPCVFPVLSIKILSLLKLSGSDRHYLRMSAWVYSFGILVSFWVLAGVLIFLRSLGLQLGWGFQLQAPQFIIILASILFLFGLNLLGIFEIGSSFMGVGQSLSVKKGYAGSFFTGVLATVVATPCTAPFMGASLGFAMTQPPWVAFLIFTTLGMGLAAPYLIICYIPAIARFLPKPGAWMNTFKQLMGFCLLGTVVWLSWVLGIQTNATNLSYLLATFLLIGIGAWILGRWPTLPKAQAFALGLILMAIQISVREARSLNLATPSSGRGVGQSVTEHGLTWEVFSPEKVAEYRLAGRPVLVDFTAAWCISCKVNELVTFGSTEVQQKLKAKNVALLRADWTSQDPMITKTLTSFGRSGVPLYIYYGKEKDSAPIVLPEVIHPGILLPVLEK